MRAVVFDFAESRAGQHARQLLGVADDRWRGTLVCDDFSGYKPMFELGITEAGCLAHARRKFNELWINHKSAVAEDALKFFLQLYEIEREVQALDPHERRRIRQLKAKPVADLMHEMADRATTARAGRLGDGQGDRLQLEPLVGADAPHRRWRPAARQQLGGEPDPTDRTRALKLAVRREFARRQESSRGDELGALGEAQRA